jgi:hypothetical protein
MKKRNHIKVRRKNPNNEIYKYFDRIEHFLPPTGWLIFKLEKLKSENEYIPQKLNLRIAYQKSLLKRFTEFYELLEINYKEFFKDIQTCLKK